MIVGVGIAFRDVFWEVATNMCQETNELFQESLDGIQAIWPSCMMMIFPDVLKVIIKSDLRFYSYHGN